MQKLFYHLLITFLILIICFKANADDKSNAKLDLEPFLSANQLALQDYSKAKSRIINNLDNLIIISGDSAYWYQHSKLIKTATINSQKYILLKSISHITLAISALRGMEDESLEARQGHYKLYNDRLKEIENTLPKKILTNEQNQRQKLIISSAKDFFAKYISDNTSEDKNYQSYYKKIAPLIEANASDCAKDKIDVMQLSVGDWIRSLDKKAKSSLIIAIGSTISSKTHQLEKQFVAKALKTSEDDKRIIMTENSFDPELQKAIVATYLIEAKIGEWMFRDPSRLHRDITADAAALYLRQ